MKICENIRRIREAKGYSQADMAKHLGLKNRSTYQNWEKATEPDITTLKKISEILDVPASSLLEGVIDFPDEKKEQAVDNTKPSEVLSKIANNDRFFKLYIESLNEQKRILEEQNNFLRRNFEVSLNSIAEGQHIANSQLKALSWYQAMLASGGDETKAEEELVKLHNKAAWYGGVSRKADTVVEAGKHRKSG